jgi:GTP cyclohydrolase I
MAYQPYTHCNSIAHVLSIADAKPKEMEMNPKSKVLDDVAVLPPERHLEVALDDVGMENVQTQVRFHGLLLPARATAGVSLVDHKSRGIHMSRLFKVINRLHEDELSWDWMNVALEQILSSHEGLSDAAHLHVDFELPLLRKALVSQEHGWRNYPVRITVSCLKGQIRQEISVRVLYSSTCPCSASLSRQALQDQFTKDFSEGSLTRTQVLDWLGANGTKVALPHSQRSEAFVTAVIEPSSGGVPAALALIDEIETALATPVQAAVKREDEQEFARLNAQNQMFCEDAARRLKVALLGRVDLADFAIEVRHFESLHAHDVVAKVRKNN